MIQVKARRFAGLDCFWKAQTEKISQLPPYESYRSLVHCRSAFTFAVAMEKITHPRSRQSLTYLSLPFRHRRPLRGAGNFLFCYCFCLFLLPALLGSCRKDPGPDGPSGETPPAPVVDSSFACIHVLADGCEVHNLDLFVYDAKDVRALDAHLMLSAMGGLPDTVRIRVPTGEKRFVAIANSPRRFNLKALERYDAMEQLSFAFNDDDPARPILSGCCDAPEQRGTVVLQPLLCRVVLASICNTMDDFELLESPRVRLRDLPDRVEILRQKDFRPAELLDAGPWVELPHDIGFFPEEPAVTLWCYPNDTPEDVLGVPRPSLELACEIKGETCSYSVPLPPIARGACVEVEITVGGPDDFRYKIR